MPVPVHNTYGSRHGEAAELAQGMLKEFGIYPSYINVVLMADNFLPGFDMEEQKRMDKKVDAQIARIREDIGNIDIWDFALTDEEMEKIAAKDLGHSEIVNHDAPAFVKMLCGMKIH